VRRPQFSLTTLYGAAFALFGWILGLNRLSDNSLFWHLRTGRLILDHGIPRTDPYSFAAPGVRWVAQSWLAELLYGVLDRTGGLVSIRFLGGVVGATLATTAYMIALRVSGERMRAVGITLVSLLGLFAYWSERPLLLGALFLVVLIWIVELPDSWLGRHAVFALPVLFWFWINVHGSFALGFGFLALHLVGRWFEGARPWDGQEGRLAGGAVIGLLVGFVNPYGYRLVLFPISLVGKTNLRELAEWKSPDFTQAVGLAFIIWLSVLIVVLAASRHRPSRRDLIVTIPFVILAFWALRNVAIAGLVTLPVLARAVAADAREKREPLDRIGRILGATLVAGFLLVGAWALTSPDLDLQGYPTKSLKLVNDRGLQGRRLLTTDYTAGLVILEQWPKQQVFIDDRLDMYPDKLVDDYLNVRDGMPGWQEALDDNDIEVIVWPARSPLASLLEHDRDWERIATIKESTGTKVDVWVRR